jgi:hypothetical protein
MGAMKRFYEDCAEAGRCPLTGETFDYLDRLEGRRQIDWIGYCEHDYVGHDGQQHVEECITMESARRLVAAGLANDEITSFVECFGDYYPLPLRCCECGCRGELVDIGHGEVACVHCA